MGFLNASCSFTRFKIIDPVPRSLWQEIPAKLKQFAFRDIDETHEERAFGWTSFDDMLDIQWQTAPPEKGAYLAFSLRLDTRRVPAGVLKKYLDLAVREEKEKLKEFGKTFLSRDRKIELKEQVKLKLMRRFLPVPAEFNVIWSTETGNVWFASTQQKVVEIFTEYFTQSFDLHLDQLTPYGLALEVLGEDAANLLDKVEPTNFVGFES